MQGMISLKCWLHETHESLGEKIFVLHLQAERTRKFMSVGSKLRWNTIKSTHTLVQFSASTLSLHLDGRAHHRCILTTGERTHQGSSFVASRTLASISLTLRCFCLHIQDHYPEPRGEATNAPGCTSTLCRRREKETAQLVASYNCPSTHCPRDAQHRKKTQTRSQYNKEPSTSTHTKGTPASTSTPFCVRAMASLQHVVRAMPSCTGFYELRWSREACPSGRRVAHFTVRRKLHT